MALGSTQPLTEMSTRNIPGGEGRPARKADILTAIYELIIYKMWEPRHLTQPYDPSRPVTKIALPCHCYIFVVCHHHDSSVGLATRLQAEKLKIRASIHCGRKKNISSSQCWDRLWGPLSLITKGIRCYFPGGKSVVARG
jgi:hypothetical protein